MDITYTMKKNVTYSIIRHHSSSSATFDKNTNGNDDEKESNKKTKESPESKKTIQRFILCFIIKWSMIFRSQYIVNWHQKVQLTLTNIKKTNPFLDGVISGNTSIRVHVWAIHHTI